MADLAKIERVQDLAMRQFADGLTSDELSELQQLVLDDDGARAAYVDYVRDTASTV
ncbi:MAG: hypothetical protein MI757_03215 [Pirellulales bacterium]|nr:hypothetical protein [Pirellulales bacterium]